eukprot:scaffold24076_cov101-Isochrysis_galbana.AAC.2
MEKTADATDARPHSDRSRNASDSWRVAEWGGRQSRTLRPTEWEWAGLCVVFAMSLHASIMSNCLLHPSCPMTHYAHVQRTSAMIHHVCGYLKQESQDSTQIRTHVARTHSHPHPHAYD